MVKEFFEGFKEGTKLFGENISVIINFILLSLVYFVGVGLTSVFAKIAGKEFLESNKKTNTYWEELNLTKKPVGEYYRQF